MFIIGFLLMSAFCLSAQDGNIRDPGKCGPQKLSLKTSRQVIQVTWEDDPSCLTLPDRLTCELQVLRTGKLLEKAVLTVTPGQLGSAHSWNSSSLLALDCVSHSVKLRYQLKSYTSPWKENQTVTVVAKSALPEVYPKDRTFEVGSNVSFCCVVPEAQNFSEMYVENLNISNEKHSVVSRQVHAFTFQPAEMTKRSCTHVRCATAKENAACAYFGYPPDDRGLQCETRDLQSVECTWTAEKGHLNVRIPKIKSKYHLLEMSGEDRPAEATVAVNWKDSVGRCRKTVKIDSGERTWILTSENVFGTVELTDTADLTKRVRMLAPEETRIVADPSGGVFLRWRWKQLQYKDLRMTCRANVSGGESNTLIEASGSGLDHADLSSVAPNVRRNVTVQCGTTAHFWKWGDPSAPLTLEDVPDAPDIWMQTRGGQVYILCKTPPASPSRARIVDYEVVWNATTGTQQGDEKAQRTCTPALILNDTGGYTVTLRARNGQRSSIPSAITVPSVMADKRERGYRVIGSNGTFNLSLPSSHQATCGYILDWCPTQRQCEEEWLKVPPNQTHATVYLRHLDKGASHSLSVYACTKGAPVLLQKRELLDCSTSLFKPLKLKQRGLGVEVSWDRLNLQEQDAFVKSYTVYFANSQEQLNLSEADPMATMVTVGNLEISTYSFTVVAQTPLGRCGNSSGSITLTGEDVPGNIWLLLIPVILFVLMAILCCRYWTCIKEKACPPIPTPVLTDKWPTTLDCVAQRPEDEVSVNVPVLLSQQNMHPPFATSRGQLTYRNLLPPLTKAQSQAAPLFRGLINNPLYDLPIHGPMAQQSLSCPDLKDGAEGYQPQSQQDTFCLKQRSEEPQSLVTCSSYISLPQ